jgi:hypothetical protein
VLVDWRAGDAARAAHRRLPLTHNQHLLLLLLLLQRRLLLLLDDGLLLGRVLRRLLGHHAALQLLVH